MNHFVPDFEIDDHGGYSVPSSSGLPRQKNMQQQDEILELLWQNGQVVVQSQNPRCGTPVSTLRKNSQQQPQSVLLTAAAATAPLPPPPPPLDSTPQPFMQEDEMISWLQCPLEFDRDLTDLLYLPPGPPPPPPPTSAPLRPPLPPIPQLSRTTMRIPDSGPSTSSRNNNNNNNNNEMRDSTVVDSSDTPAVRQKLKIPMTTRNAVEICDRGNRGRDGFGGRGGDVGVASMVSGGMSMSTREFDTCDLTLTSSPGGSGGGASDSATATADLMSVPSADARKRKGRDENNEYQSEDVEIESYEPKKQTRGAATKRSRAAEVHNMSERRRRDRINEKMKVLQELIPRCSKTDKASMLDEAIDYLKSLQMQVQMMSSMGCGMVPMMFPGVQQYMPTMGMGMGMGMGMEMGMTRPMMPFPGVLPGSALPTQGAAPSHMNTRFPLQAFQMPPLPGPDPSRLQQAINQGDTSVNPGLNMSMIPNLIDPYQQCVGMQQMPLQIPQNQLTRQPSISKPSPNRGGVDK